MDTNYRTAEGGGRMKTFRIVIEAIKTNELLMIQHFVRTEEEMQASEIATEDIQRLIKQGWLVQTVNVGRGEE